MIFQDTMMQVSVDLIPEGTWAVFYVLPTMTNNDVEKIVRKKYADAWLSYDLWLPKYQKRFK